MAPRRYGGAGSCYVISLDNLGGGHYDKKLFALSAT
jgi:hypothetical protein